MLTFLPLHGTPAQRGEQHGEALRDAIQELVDIRWTLMGKRSAVKERERLDGLAEEQWGYTEAAWPELTQELDGVARAARVTRRDLVVLNNYTDFRDIVPDAGGCTAVYAQTGSVRLLGQTWDMHASAERFVTGLELDHMLLLTVAGCLGMMGVNRYGAGVCVNNLVSNDAQTGVMWPALVRAMLAGSDRAAMQASLEAARLCSGHNYLLADRTGAENWETSGRQKRRTWVSSGDGVFFHTNHYLDAALRSCEGAIPKQSTTFERYRRMDTLATGDPTVNTVVAWLSDHDGAPRSVCSHLGTDDPDASKTCGGVVADLAASALTAWKGCLRDPGNEVVERRLPGVETRVV